MVIMIGRACGRAFDGGALDRHAAGAQLIDVFHHDDAGLHRNAEQRHKADAGRDAEVRPVM
jgi:hypothetical protein